MDGVLSSSPVLQGRGGGEILWFGRAGEGEIEEVFLVRTTTGPWSSHISPRSHIRRLSLPLSSLGVFDSSPGHCHIPTYFHRVHSFDPWSFHVCNHSSEASKTLSDESSGEQLCSRTRIVTKPPTLLLSLTSTISLEFSESHKTHVEVWPLPLARNIHGAHSWDQVSCVSG